MIIRKIKGGFEVKYEPNETELSEKNFEIIIGKVFEERSNRFNKMCDTIKEISNKLIETYDNCEDFSKETIDNLINPNIDNLDLG